MSLSAIALLTLGVIVMVVIVGFFIEILNTTDHYSPEKQAQRSAWKSLDEANTEITNRPRVVKFKEGQV